MQGDREKGLPLVGLKKLKKMLKACRMEIEAQAQQRIREEEGDIGETLESLAIVENKCDNKCSGNCPGTKKIFMLMFFLFLFSFLKFALCGGLFGKFVGLPCN